MLNESQTEQPDKRAARERPDLSALRMEPEETPRRRSRWPLLAVTAVLLIAAVVALRLPLPWLLPRVETTTVLRVTPTQASAVLNATGYTYARTRAAVGAKIIGRITELEVDEGDRIARGDVIAVLDSADLEAAVRRAEAAVVEAEARLADAAREEGRQRRIVEAEVAPQADLDAAVTRLEVAEAQLGTARASLDSIKAQLAYTVIRSPIDGVVIERNAEVGEMVAPGGFASQQATGAIVRIADPESLEVEADINEAYISRLELGQPASIQVDAVPSHAYRGKLRQIVPTADRQRATVEVKVTIEDRDERLVPEMGCRVTFLGEEMTEALLDAAPKVLVAAEALVVEDTATFVFLVVDGVLVKKAVTPGGSGNDGTVEITGGLDGGETVVKNPTAELTHGQRIRTAVPTASNS